MKEEITGLHRELEDKKPSVLETTNEGTLKPSVQNVVQREDIKPIFTGEHGCQYSYEEFRAFMENRLADEEYIATFADDKARIRLITKFLDGDASFVLFYINSKFFLNPNSIIMLLQQMQNCNLEYYCVAQLSLY